MTIINEKKEIRCNLSMTDTMFKKLLKRAAKCGVSVNERIRQLISKDIDDITIDENNP